MTNVATQWKPGQSGNINGRPKAIAKIRDDFLKRMASKYDSGWDELLDSLKQEGLSGNVQALKLICDHLLPKQLANAQPETEESISLAHLKTDEAREKARKITERAYEEIRCLGEQND